MTNIKITKSFVKIFLFISRFFSDNNFVVVCKGYDADEENYTGLYWDDDKDIYLRDDTYYDFQLWFRAGKNK
jgi:hypothetical protein